jgi:hypothetical protein
MPRRPLGCARSIQISPGDGASDAPEACHCGGAGVPCPACNLSDRDHPPEMPEGYQSLIS